MYQTVFDLLPRKRDFFKGKVDVKEGFFFGFHDISAFSDDESKILANKPDIFLRMPKPNESLGIGYFNFEESNIGDFVPCAVSTAWNHHKGCRLQWLSTSEFIFNSSFDGKLGAAIFRLGDKSTIRIDFPIDTVHRDKRIATSFSYERLEKLMPGYGYPYQDDSFLVENAPKETGIFLVDLERNSRELLVSLKELVEQLNDGTLFKYRHYVTHSEFSVDGRYVSFLHRWVGDDVMKRWSRLVIFDLATRKFFALPTSGMVSHYIWNGRNQIVAYCSIDGIDGHVIFDVPNTERFKFVANDKLNSDGHQSFVSNEVFITDTYPDKHRTAKVYLVNTRTNEVELLASVYSPKKYQSKLPYKHIACDLHPRVSPSSKFVCFDTVFPGIRSLAVMKIS